MRKDAGSLALSLTTRYMRGCLDSHLHLTLHVSHFDNATDLSLMLDLELGSRVSLGHGDLAGLRSYGCGPLTRVGSGLDVFGLPGSPKDPPDVRGTLSHVSPHRRSVR